MNNCKAIQISDNIYWTGAVDWSIETSRGTSYNAYLIIDDKITLIDTAKITFADELLARISSVVDPAQIDVIVSSHVEPDHSGALREVAALASQRAQGFDGALRQAELSSRQGRRRDFCRQAHAEICPDAHVALA